MVTVTLPYLNLTIASLLTSALGYVVLGIVLGPVGGMAWMMDDPYREPLPPSIMMIFSAIMVAVCVGVAILNVVAVVGLRRRAKWGWFLSLVLGLIYLPSLCLPFGLAIFLPLLQAEVREAFGL